jgi:hypothetical protein
LWPDASLEEQTADTARRQHAAHESAAYADLAEECGRFELAGKAVAVPFVGTTAASFVVAETLRLYHGGPAYADLKIRLATPHDLYATATGMYGIEAIAEMQCVRAVGLMDTARP